MKFSKLGNTELDVSRICLGTMTWGEQNSEAEAHEQMDYAIEQGINFFDTAEMYPVPPRAETQGRTEQYIGSWFASRGTRDKVLLATKVAGPGDWLSHIRGGSRLNEQHMVKALEQSLVRLQTDYIDLYQLHWPERATNYFGQLGYRKADDGDAVPLSETLVCLKKLIDQGKIRHWGLSNETPWGVMTSLRVADEIGLPAPVSIQNPYNLLNRGFELGLAECADRESVGLLAYSPLAFGVLSGKYRHGAKPKNSRLTLFSRFTRYNGERAQMAVEAYAALAGEVGLSLTELSLAFVNHQSFVTSNIIGATSLEQLRENIGSIDVELSEEVLVQLEKLHQKHTIPCP
jgi:aryl-alcohol dehydrogenase-like predicted oxidoreductase